MLASQILFLQFASSTPGLALAPWSKEYGIVRHDFVFCGRDEASRPNDTVVGESDGMMYARFRRDSIKVTDVRSLYAWFFTIRQKPEDRL